MRERLCGDAAELVPLPKVMNKAPKSDTGSLYTRDGNYIFFGEYPTSHKSAEVEITDKEDPRGYLFGSDGCLYARVTARPRIAGCRFHSGEEILSGESCFFKVEPIRWRILSEEGGVALLLSEGIIANIKYQADVSEAGGEFYTAANGALRGTYANNYKYSAVRRWLNEDLFLRAFSADERRIIDTTVVDNGVSTTAACSKNPYTCEDTRDPVFLLSYRDIEREDYGFGSWVDRLLTVTDYARACGAYISTSESGYGNGFWWLRSPAEKRSDQAMTVTSNKMFNKLTTLVNADGIGVAPAIVIKL